MSLTAVYQRCESVCLCVCWDDNASVFRLNCCAREQHILTVRIMHLTHRPLKRRVCNIWFPASVKASHNDFHTLTDTMTKTHRCLNWKQRRLSFEYLDICGLDASYFFLSHWCVQGLQQKFQTNNLCGSSAPTLGLWQSGPMGDSCERDTWKAGQGSQKEGWRTPRLWRTLSSLFICVFYWGGVSIGPLLSSVVHPGPLWSSLP